MVSPHGNLGSKTSNRLFQNSSNFVGMRIWHDGFNAIAEYIVLTTVCGV